MKKSLLSLTALATLVTTAPAANIAFLSFHTADNTPSAAAGTAGFTQAPDVGYTQLLAANGHTVTRVLTSATPDTALLNTFDLVIISRSVDSGHYNNGAPADLWNTSVTAPTMILGGYILRNSRLNFTNGGNMPDTFVAGNATTETVSLTADAPGHPIFAGISLDGGNVMNNPFATEVSFLGTEERGISINNDALVGGGTLIAHIPGLTPGTGPGMVIGEWSAGSVLGNGDVLGGDRLVFLTGSREHSGLTTNGSGIYDLTADGETMFLNAVNYLAIPEPSGAVLALLGLTGLAARRRR